MLRPSLILGLAVVDFARNPVLQGSLARSTTPKWNVDKALDSLNAEHEWKSKYCPFACATSDEKYLSPRLDYENGFVPADLA